jgi:predicted transcriptional regulator
LKKSIKFFQRKQKKVILDQLFSKTLSLAQKHSNVFRGDVIQLVRNTYEISPKKAQILTHNIRWQIMELLSSDETLYAKSIAKILNLSEQKVHYHLTKLRNAGLLVPTGVKPVKRGRAKLFNPIANHFMLSLM